MNLHEYNADVNEVLGKRKSPSNLLRFGAEVETGWHVEGARNDFFKALEAEGIDKLAIPKFDRSITSNQCAEIVTLPLKAEELSGVMTTIGRILTKQTKDSSMQNCGVHIHATRTAMHTDQFWRAVSGIMIKRNDWQHYWTPNVARTNDAVLEFNKRVEVITEFWTKLALRNPTQYCTRFGFTTLANAEVRGRHNQAVTIGKHTPTVEFRLFKTARSPVVLASYPEAVAALLAFSDAPPPDLLDTKNLDAVKEQQRYDAARRRYLDILIAYDLDKMIEDMVGYRRGTLRGEIGEQRDPIRYFAHYGTALTKYILNGYEYDEIYGAGEDKLIKNQVPHFVSRELYEELYALRNDLVVPQRDSIGAVSWKDNLFPVHEFMAYIEHNGNTYPNLAERLKLPKFTSMIGRNNGVFVADVPEPYDTTTPHTNIRYGCLVSDQGFSTLNWGGEGPLYRVVRRRKDGKGIVAEDFTYEVRQIVTRGTSPANEAVYEDSNEILGSDIIHKCEGALRQEGHDE